MPQRRSDVPVAVLRTSVLISSAPCIENLFIGQATFDGFSKRRGLTALLLRLRRLLAGRLALVHSDAHAFALLEVRPAMICSLA